MILAGDVGGTNTVLGLFELAAPRPRPVDIRAFRSAEFDSFLGILTSFLSGQAASQRSCDAACFGVAGPVVDGRAQLTNISWIVDAEEVAAALRIAHVSLINDLQAWATVVPAIGPDEVEVLQEGQRDRTGNCALIAAGTGLGEALLHNVGGRLIPAASEGGHADFAARTPREVELADALGSWYGRARYEDVLSGRGLLNIYRVVHSGRDCPPVPFPHDARSTPPLISEAALSRRCPMCVEALQMFVSAYGAEAGNLALRSVATGGLYVGGGIAVGILAAMKDGTFMKAFLAKSPMLDLISRIPVAVILDPRAGLLGAAVHAATTLGR
jgi:glucokinase